MNISEIYKLLKEQNFHFSTDSRTIATGDVYFALRGENMDGNAYAADALAKGAAFAIIDNEKFSSGEKYILVKDTLATLQELAHFHRKTFSIPIIVVGGSNGKTTTKELLVAALSGKYNVHATRANFNNHFGVPMTLLGLKPEHEIAVIEVGANHPLEHEQLAAIIEPTHLYITNHGKDHLEGFGSIEGVRSANNELLVAAKKFGTTVFINKNIPEIYEDATSMNLKTAEIDSDYEIEQNIFAIINYKHFDQKNQSITFQTQLVGDYNAPNIAAAVSIAHFFSVPLEKIQEKLSEYVPGLMRSQLIERDGMRIILDCYNANPSSMLLSLQSFFAQKNQENNPDTQKPRPKLAIIGDMRELGAFEQSEHQAIVDYLEMCSCEEIVLVGEQFQKTTGLARALRFPDSISAKSWFDSTNHAGFDIFIKASRGTALEKVVNMVKS
ncbi:MAG TPA: UDP-N-acetylmuramoyl-tripeptide--D-alanyl-D-alanine ligase [Candidatus Paceibacterota bacterium]|nr:UDP-N-acetylmuramoyl-tripeptide--D-alanyl-D-alanine ligase [Candidatus Paceibacterota bacterium]